MYAYDVMSRARLGGMIKNSVQHSRR